MNKQQLVRSENASVPSQYSQFCTCMVCLVSRLQLYTANNLSARSTSYGKLIVFAQSSKVQSRVMYLQCCLTILAAVNTIGVFKYSYSWKYL